MKLQYDLAIDIGRQKMDKVYEYADRIKVLRDEEAKYMEMERKAKMIEARKNAKTD